VLFTKENYAIYYSLFENAFYFHINHLHGEITLEKSDGMCIIKRYNYIAMKKPYHNSHYTVLKGKWRFS